MSRMHRIAVLAVLALGLAASLALTGCFGEDPIVDPASGPERTVEQINNDAYNTFAEFTLGQVQEGMSMGVIAGLDVDGDGIIELFSQWYPAIYRYDPSSDTIVEYFQCATGSAEFLWFPKAGILEILTPDHMGAAQADYYRCKGLDMDWLATFYEPASWDYGMCGQYVLNGQGVDRDTVLAAIDALVGDEEPVIPNWNLLI